MRFVSTQGRFRSASFSEVVRGGAAPDGGLYICDRLPSFSISKFDPAAPLADFAALFLEPFFKGDPLEEQLRSICAEAFNFPVPLVKVDPNRQHLRILELFHGPTGAFKDFGARFLMACFERLENKDPLTILAATSGDTGGAVGCAAEERSLLRAMILYPKGRVSPFQERQLTCWGRNVQAIEVDGDFDDCQRLVKAAFADRKMVIGHRLTSANSINIGRLLPQLAYSAWAAAQVHAETGRRPGFVVPTGNLGHGYAILLSRAVGMPVGPVVLATNANRTLKDWCETGRFEPRASVATLANAMDVGDPSNFERLAALSPDQRDVRVERVEDREIKARIVSEHAATGHVWCPHSAVGLEAWSRLPDRNNHPWIVSSTAHPFKFREVIEPLIGAAVEPSPSLAALTQRPSRKRQIAPRLDALAEVLREFDEGPKPSTGSDPITGSVQILG